MKYSSPFHVNCDYFLLLMVVQSPHHVQFFVTPWTAACQASLSFTISWRFLKLMSIESVMPPNHLILCHLLLLLSQSLPTSGSFPMSQLFTSGGQSIGASASTSILSMSIQGWFPWGLTGLISLRTDWFDLLAVQGNLKSLLQHHTSKAWIHWHSALFMV